ncbi:MAG: carboxypeptidase regulatory-like domain-containing protein [Bacteroidales bacterium]|jgi:hypothetical protein|nr:carboxypeptidase regulatory-like domain-containing protein [Bacteroidales bacterium]
MKARKFFTKLMGVASATLLVALFTSACTKVDEPMPLPQPQPATYSIKGEVYNNSTNAALAGVTVKMGTLTATTNATGKFEFLNLTAAGKYTINLTKDGFLATTITLEFPSAAPNHAMIYTVSAKMVPYVPGGTYIEPSVGGTLFIEGGTTDATLGIAANTVVKDATGATITTPYQIVATPANDQVVGTVLNPALKVFNFAPTGYTFSPALSLKVDNAMTSYYYPNLILQYFTNNAWVTQTTPVTYDAALNDYVTSISHFSSYKIAFDVPVTAGTTTTETIKVYDSLKINRGLTSASWSNWKHVKKGGYVLSQPLDQTLAALGITGADQGQIITDITNSIKFFNNGVAALTAFSSADDTFVSEKTIPSLTYLIVTGKQSFTRKIYTFKVKTGTTEKTITVTTIHAGAVELFFDPKIYDEHAHGHYHGHDHGLGGGGTV